MCKIKGIPDSNEFRTNTIIAFQNQTRTFRTSKMTEFLTALQRAKNSSMEGMDWVMEFLQNLPSINTTHLQTLQPENTLLTELVKVEDLRCVSRAAIFLLHEASRQLVNSKLFNF